MMRTLCFAKEERKSERERERAREKELDHPKSSKPQEGPPHKISNLLVLDPRRERSHQKQSFVRTVYFPDRMTTCKRLLMPSCVFFDESFDILKRGLFGVCVCNKLAFLSSDAANFFRL